MRGVPYDKIRQVPVHLSDEEVWLRAWTSLLVGRPSVTVEVCSAYADCCLDEFKERFRTEAQGYYVEPKEQSDVGS